MKSKKFLSAALAGVLALSLSVPALAASTAESNGSQNYQVDADVKNATIKITVPADLTGNVKLNPYQLAYTDTASGTEIKEAIFSPVQYMTNLSDTAIGVTAKVKATKGGDVKLLSEADYTTAMAKTDGTTEVEKNVTMYLEMVTVNDNTTIPTWATAYDAAKHLALVEAATSANGQQKKNIATMEASTDGTTAAAEKGMVAFHFAGKANDKPDEAWDADDKVALDITFTFTPLLTTTGVTASADEAGSASTPVTPTTYNITSASCATGTFTVDQSSAASGATVTVTAGSPTNTGDTATVTVTKDSDSSSVAVTSGAGNTFTFTMPAEDVTVTVVYA